LINRYIVLTLELKIIDNWTKDHQIILDKIFTVVGLPDDIDIQKKKFSLLTELFLKLCTNKNCKSKFKNISSLILLLLNIYKKNYPVDVFSKEKSENLETKRKNSELKRILKKELRKTKPIL